MTGIFHTLHRLQATTKRNEKIAILKEHADNKTLQRVLVHALDPFWVYNIRQYNLPAPTAAPSVTIDEFISELPKFRDRVVSGHAAHAHLGQLLSRMSHNDQIVADRILQKDLRCGVAAGTVNSVWPDLVFSYPCLLGSAYSEALVQKNVRWPATAQLKLDGLRVNAFVDSDKKTVMLLTRAGKLIDINCELDYSLLFLHSMDDPSTPMMYDGELLVVDNLGNVLSRKVGNGILNKAIRGTISADEASRVRIRLWDRVPQVDFYRKRCDTPAYERFESLRKACHDRPEQTTFAALTKDLRFSLVDYRTVANLDEAIAYFNEAVASGEEGIMLKNIDHVWEDKRSKDIIKFKCENHCELEVIDWLEGTGKYTGFLGKLLCRSSDGLLEVNVGSGFSDEFRQTVKPGDIIGKIITVRFNEVISSEDKPGMYSLFLGRFIEVREDKDTADDLNNIRSTKVAGNETVSD